MVVANIAATKTRGGCALNMSELSKVKTSLWLPPSFPIVSPAMECRCLGPSHHLISFGPAVSCFDVRLQKPLANALRHRVLVVSQNRDPNIDPKTP